MNTWTKLLVTWGIQFPSYMHIFKKETKEQKCDIDGKCVGVFLTLENVVFRSSGHCYQINLDAKFINDGDGNYIQIHSFNDH